MESIPIGFACIFRTDRILHQYKVFSRYPSSFDFREITFNGIIGYGINGFGYPSFTNLHRLRLSYPIQIQGNLVCFGQSFIFQEYVFQLHQQLILTNDFILQNQAFLFSIRSQFLILETNRQPIEIILGIACCRYIINGPIRCVRHQIRHNFTQRLTDHIVG